MSDRFSILSVYPKKPGQTTKFSGNVSFVFKSDGLTPVQFYRSYETVKTASGRGRQLVCEVSVPEGTPIRVMGAGFGISDKGEPYVISDVSVPREIADAVAVAALDRLPKAAAGGSPKK